jgi:hypothetical protein
MDGALMRLYLTILLTSIFALYGLQKHADNSLRSAHIHWSTPSILRSPDGRWVLYVKPSHSEDDSANVYVSRAGTQSQLPLFRLQRDAEVYWRQGQDFVAIVDEKSSNEYRLLIFALKNPSEQSALALNAEIAQDVKQHLGSGNQIAYYFPHFSRWTGEGDFLATVGVVTVHNGSGPFTPHCFGYIADDESQKIKSRLSESDLKEKYGESCQIWP